MNRSSNGFNFDRGPSSAPAAKHSALALWTALYVLLMAAVLPFNVTAQSAPTVAITSPSSGATVSDTISVTANASDNREVVGVQFQLDGINAGAEATTAPYSISWNTTTASNGLHTLTAVARDAKGNQTTSSAVTVTVFNDTTAPTVGITSPTSAATVSGTISVTANAADNVGVVSVQFQRNGINVGAEATTAPYSISWNTTTASNGSHTLTAVARDAKGNQTTSSAVTVTVFNDTTLPTVSITSPASASTVAGTITMTASASDNGGVVGVQFQHNGANFGAEVATAPYSVSWNTTTAANGSHILTAVARDAASNLNTSAPVTVTVANYATPYTGTPIAVPGMFEAENFDLGGEGIAYHDNVKGNTGAQYRTTEDVDIILSSDSLGGGYVVNNFETGEWLAYSINVATSAQYDIEIRASTTFSGSAFHIEIDGTNVTGSIVVPNTGSWNSFAWVGKKGVSLTAGQHVFKIVADQQYFNLNSVRVTATPTSAPTPTPYTGTPMAIPGTFEAENFDLGGEGVGYHDNVAGNAGGQYRPGEDVDIVVSTDSAGGGYVVNNFETGEWLAYTISVQSTALYDIEIRASSAFSNSVFHIEIDGVDVTGSIIVPNTGSWNSFQWVGKKGVSLTAGQHVFKIVVDQQYFNLNSLRLMMPPDTAAPSTPTGLTASALTSTSLTLSWDAATDNVGVTGYQVYRDGTLVASPTSTSVSITGLAASTLYSFTVAALDAAGNASAQSAPVSVTTPAPFDITAPLTPTGLTASAVTSTSLTLSWSAATDNVSVNGYHVYRDGVQVASVSGTSHSETGLSAATTYSYAIAAYDVAGNVSAQSAAVSVTTSPLQTAYSGTPIVIPGAFEAENFDRGGEGVGYHDNVPGNAGGQYRPGEDVDIILSADSLGGGYVVNNFETGEWLAYTINVAASARYDIEIRASTTFSTSAFHVEIDGVNMTGTVTVPNTGSWSAFQWTGKKGVPLTVGKHVLKIVADQQFFNLNSLRLTATADTQAPSIPANLAATAVSSSQIDLSWNVATDNVGVSGYYLYRNGVQVANVSGTSHSDTGLSAATTYDYSVAAYDAAGNVSAPSATVSATTTLQQPFSGTPISIPGSFEAENFDLGGEGVGYHDNVAGNAGGQYRPGEDVDIILSADSLGGGYVVNNFETGEWLAYSISVQGTALYDIEIRASSAFSNSAFHIEIDGVNVTGSIIVANTGSWNSFQWVGKKGVPLTAGTHLLKIVSDQQYFNLNSARVAATSSNPPPADPGTVSFFCTFLNSPTDCGFGEQAKVPGRATIVNIGRDGVTAVRLHTEPGDSDVSGSGSNERNDITLSQSETDCYEGREQWWAHSILFPTDYVAPPSGWGVAMDFHHTGSGGQANFHVDAMPNPTGLRLRGYGGPTVDSGKYEVVLGPVVKNVWYDFVYHVKWSSGADGFLDAWVNGVQKLAHRGPTIYAGMGCYLKLANYHSAFGQPSSVIHDRVIRGTTPLAVSLGPLEGVLELVNGVLTPLQ